MFDQAVRLREVVSTQTKVLPLSKLPYKVTVVSGKGGVGKSNIVLNLGIALASEGARVLLVDGNINLSNLDILSGVSPSRRLFDVIEGTARLEDAIAQIVPNVYLLAGTSDGKLKKLTSNDAAILFREVSMMEPAFQYAVIDTAGGIVQESISLALLSDEVLVVSTPEPTALMDAYVLVKVIKRINSSADLKLLINNTKDAGEAGDVKTKFDLVSQHFLSLKLDYAGFVPSDESVEQAVCAQSPFIREFPDSPSSCAIKSIADKIQFNVSRSSSGKKR